MLPSGKPRRILRPTARLVSLIFATIAATIGLAALAAPPEANQQSLQEISDTARAHVEQLHENAESEVVVEPGHIDPRLRLKACAEPLQASLASPSGTNANSTVRVQCPGTWRLFVPVKVAFRTPVVVLNSTVPSGTVLQSRHLGTRVADINRLSYGYFTDPDTVAGQVLRGPGATGSVVTPAMLEPAVMIRKGQNVRLVVSARNYRINATGKALSDAVEGQRLRVQNLSSQRVVEGIAIGPDTVAVR